jgi:putative transposase
MSTTENAMPGVLHKIWLHVVLSTFNSDPIINSKLEPFLYKHLQHLLKESGCSPLIINGMPEHVHLLVLINPDKSISEIVRQVKKESAQTINLAKLTETDFVWQNGYAAYSVSESQVDKVKEYISMQKEYHKKISFKEESEKFLQAHKLEMINESASHSG